MVRERNTTKHWVILILMMFLLTAEFTVQGQQEFSARNGGSIPAHGSFRILNIYINIVYDQTPERDPFYNTETPVWKAGNPDKLNDNPPTYLLNFLDTEKSGNAPKGLMSRLFYESSLGHFVLLGDFMVVNIRQSEITPVKPGANFGVHDVIRTAINKITQLGGVTTIYGHDSIADYDFFEKGTAGKEKKFGSNGKIDFLMFCTRNTYRKEEGGRVLYNYGQLNSGEGNSYESNACSKCSLLMGGKALSNEITTVQNVGVSDNGNACKNISFHEFAHCLFGGNAFHTSGGNHFGTPDAAVFMGLQGGYGLMGGANSSLVSCNGYERWRMGWIDTVDNTQGYDIAVKGENADLTKQDGAKTFILRDFVSTGDAVRIRFPYEDAGAEPQFLWLENHQVGQNGKIDFLQFSNEDDCRPQGSAGIYAYIQVGKTRLSGNKLNEIYPGDQTDNLRMLSAKGNWDMRLDTYYDTTTCIAWKVVKPAESYKRENPFCGYNDLQTHFWDTTGSAVKIDGKTLCTYPWIIRRMGIKEAPLPFLGDNNTAFSGRSTMNLSSNPAAVNVVTSYTTQYNMQFAAYKKINTKNIYLTGLSVQMQPVGDGLIKVDVRWDQYRIEHNVRWTGSIILKEQLYLDDKTTLLLDQNETPVQLERDTASGYFSPATRLVCDSGSVFITGKKSKLVLDQKSTLIISKGARFEIGAGCKLIIRNGSKVVIDQGALFENKGKIVLKGGRFYGAEYLVL